MSTPITPMDLFREFSAMEDEADAENGSRHAYGIAVDLVDGMLKGATMDQWKSIYTHIRKAAQDNRDLFVIMNEQGQAEALAWNEIMGTLDIAIESLNDDTN